MLTWQFKWIATSANLKMIYLNTVLFSCVRSHRGGVPSSAGRVWHHGGAGHAARGESVRRTEESCGFRSDDHALVKHTSTHSHGPMLLLLLHLTSSLVVSLDHSIMQLYFSFLYVSVSVNCNTPASNPHLHPDFHRLSFWMTLICTFQTSFIHSDLVLTDVNKSDFHL